MSVFDRMFHFNTFAKYFKDAKTNERHIEEEGIKNSQGISEVEMQLQNSYASQRADGYAETAGVVYTGVAWDQYFTNKVTRILKYREMAFFPEISDAIDMICDEAVIPDANGNTISLDLNKEVPRHIEEHIRDIWDYLISNVFAFNDVGWELFRKWLIDSEMYIEMILNDEGNNIIDYKVLSPLTMMPIYRDNKIIGYVQTLQNNVLGQNQSGGYSGETEKQKSITFDKDQILYSNYGLYSEGMDSRGYLESAIRTYNQLRNLEDSLVIYRLVRAPERRVWNIATGRMPKGKAEEYIKGMIQRYKKRIIYDPETGGMSSTQNVQALTEDFWFAKNETGEGTTVETIGGGMHLGELEDINYFLKKLYKTLKLPRSRWDDSAGTNYSSGKSGELLREEVKFSRYVERLQNRFSRLILDAFLTLLSFRGVDDKYIDETFFNIEFTSSNLFKQYKEMELNESRFGLLASINEFVYDKENNPNGYFAPEFVLKDVIMFSDHMYQKNMDMLEKLKSTGSIEGEEGVEAGDDMGFGTGMGAGLSGGDFGGGGGDIGSPEGNMGDLDMGDEIPDTEGDTELSSPMTTAPESTTFDVMDDEEMKISGLFSNWLNDDKTIRDKYSKQDGLIDNSDKIV